MNTEIKAIAPSEMKPITRFARAKLSEINKTQSSFCRDANFDQGLMSKLLNNYINNLSLDSILKLSIGFKTPAREICILIGAQEQLQLLEKYEQLFHQPTAN